MLEIAKIVLPAFIVMLLALFFFDRMTSNKKAKVDAYSKMERLKIVLPLRMSGVERLIVMLERIKPNAMVMRLNKGGMSAAQLNLELIKALREEFAHNVSLQMYVSDRSWEAIVNAREETAQLFKVAGSKVPADSNALTLSQEILALEQKVGNSAIDLALRMLKLEIQSEFH